MSAELWLWAGVGIVTGAAQALALWRASRHPASWEGLAGIFRIAGVGAVLLVAAWNQALLPAAVGWGIGLPSVGGAFLLGSRR